MTKTTTFFGDPKIKEKYLTRLQKLYDGDELKNGLDWESGERCGVRCTDHADYERLLGIPSWIAYVEDEILKILPDAQAKTWPIDFLKAIPVGVDLDQIKPAFLIWMLEQAKTSTNDEEVIAVIEKVISLWKRPDLHSEVWFRDADAAHTAASATFAAYAARSVDYADSADSAAASYAAYAAWAACTAYTAADAAYDASAAARSAAYAAYAAAFYAYCDARNQFWVKCSEKLLELISGTGNTNTNG